MNHVNSGYSFHPRGSIRETSLRVDSGQDGPTEWSRREESIRETGESQFSHASDMQNAAGRYVTSPIPLSQSAKAVPVNGLSPLPPFPAPITSSASSGFRVTRKPTVVSRNGDSEIITTEEMKKEDENSETIIQRRTIRRSKFLMLIFICNLRLPINKNLMKTQQSSRCSRGDLKLKRISMLLSVVY